MTSILVEICWELGLLDNLKKVSKIEKNVYILELINELI